jgi:hypothetical protein
MKHYGMRTRGIYLIPLLGAAAVAQDNFPSRRAEATIALAGPLTGAVLAAGTGLLYFATRNGAFAAAAAWMALVNLFNLLPVVPLDGGRVVKSITCSIGSRTGLVAVITGMLLGAVLAVTADLWIFVILIPLGLLDYLYDSYQVNQAAWRPKPGAGGMRASLKPGVRLRCEPPRTSRCAAICPETANGSARMMPSRPRPASDMAEFGLVTIIEPSALAYALVRLGESLLCADVLAARKPDVATASRLQQAIIEGILP